MLRIAIEKKFGKVHKQHKHTDRVGFGLGYKKYCFECGEQE